MAHPRGFEPLTSAFGGQGVTAGLPLLTIAQISGTSAEMIERHYGHLASDAALKALGQLAF